MKRSAIVLSLLMLLSFTVNARVDRRFLQDKATKEQVKESLVMNQKWVTYPAYKDRQGWDKYFGSFKDYYIKQGESKLHFDWKVVKATDYLEYERSGNRRIQESLVGANNSAIASLLLAELAEGKGRFIDDLIDGVYQACEMTSWAWSAHVPLQKTNRSLPSYDDPVFDLLCGEMGNMLSWTYYFMKDEFDKVDPEISRRLRHELQVNVLDTFLHNNTFWWMARDSKRVQNNWNPWCNSNALISFMLLENDRDTLADAVYLSMESIDKYLGDVNADGGCDEGPSYWGAAAGKLYDYLDMLNTITNGRVNIFDNPMIKAMGEYIYRSYVGNGWVVNFADASAKGGGGSYLVYRYGKDVKSEGMMRYAAALRGDLNAPAPSTDIYRVFKSLDIRDEVMNAKPEIITEPFTWYPETQFCYLSNKEGMFVATKGGHNDESHNHNDIGSFILYMNQTPMMIDIGVGTYTRQTFSSERYNIWTMQSNYHNLPMINGVPEKQGREYKAADAVAKKNFFSVNIANTYPQEAKVEKWIRSYQLKGKELRINDQFTLKETVAPNQVNFMTWGDVQKVSDGKVSITVNGVKALLVYDASTFDLNIETKDVNDGRLTPVWGNKVYRLSLNAKKMTMKGNYSFVIKKQ